MATLNYLKFLKKTVAIDSFFLPLKSWWNPTWFFFFSHLCIHLFYLGQCKRVVKAVVWTLFVIMKYIERSKVSLASSFYTFIWTVKALPRIRRNILHCNCNFASRSRASMSSNYLDTILIIMINYFKKVLHYRAKHFWSKLYLGFWQMFTMKLFVNIAASWNPLNIFTKKIRHRCLAGS